jgi:hypothetical protein
MWTTQLSAAMHPTPRLGVRADAYRRWLETGPLRRSALGATVTATFQLEPGWTLTAGAGGAESDAPGAEAEIAYRLGLSTPPRHPLVAGVSFESLPLDATAVLAQTGVRTAGATATLRWTPDPLWRIDVAAGRTRFDGTQANERNSGFVSASRRMSRLLTLGASARAFEFEQDLSDGYFDPDFYGIAEVTGRALHQAAPWTLLLEIAPGMQKATSDGDATATIRASARAAYALGPGRELSLSAGSSTTGLQSFTSGASSYRYTALILGVGWRF